MILSNETIKKIISEVWESRIILRWTGVIRGIQPDSITIQEEKTKKEYVLNSESIQKGYDLIIIGATTVPDSVIHLLETEQYDDEKLIDAIVQVGLLGEFKYE